MSLKSTGPPAVMQSRVNDGVAASVADVNSNWTDWILGAPARLKFMHYQILCVIISTLVSIAINSNKYVLVGSNCIRYLTAVDSSW